MGNDNTFLRYHFVVTKNYAKPVDFYSDNETMKTLNNQLDSPLRLPFGCRRNVLICLPRLLLFLLISANFLVFLFQVASRLN